MPPSYLRGVDVSHWQGAVDWAKVAKNGASFAFTKATEGASTDSAFETNWPAMKAQGLTRGAYHFLRPSVSAEAQANHYCDVVGALGAGDLSPVVDVEPAGPAKKGDEWTALALPARKLFLQTYLEVVSDRLGRMPIVYTYTSFWKTQFGDTSDFAENPLWLARYGVDKPKCPAAWPSWTFWQHSETGKWPGIAGNVDLNRFAGTAADLAKIAGG